MPARPFMPLDHDPLTAAQRQTCPLCGQPNRCRPSSCGDLDTPCWCTSVTFNPTSLALIPPGLRNVVCLCQACAVRPPMNL